MGALLASTKVDANDPKKKKQPSASKLKWTLMVAPLASTKVDPNNPKKLKNKATISVQTYVSEVFPYYYYYYYFKGIDIKDP